MKVVSAKQMKVIEAQAIQDGASQTDFMEEAGSGIALVVHDFIEKRNLEKHVILLCGKGNNGGDAYVTGLYLLNLEYIVTAFQAHPIDECSQLCRQNYARFLEEGGHVEENFSTDAILFPSNGVIVDGLFGTGFHGKVEEPIRTIIQAANQSRLPIIAVDIPSGLNGETGEAAEDAIIATQTAFLGLPKTGFFLRDGWDHVGQLEYVNFGLENQYIENSQADMVMLSSDLMKFLLPRIKHNRHKYQAGYVVGLAGSASYAGASVLSSWSALKGGAGIVRLFYPSGIEAELASAPYELIKEAYNLNETSRIIEQMNKASAVFVGPGMGLSDEVKKLLSEVLPKIEVPCVIDADALTIISEMKITLPKICVLTPHLGEMNRLIHKDVKKVTLEYLADCQNFARQKNLTVVLKGGASFICHPDEPMLVNPRGDPGMATAGSGDVLTGLIASLLAQGLTARHAAALGVYIHGIAGEWAAHDLTSYTMTASDIVNYYAEAFDPYNW